MKTKPINRTTIHHRLSLHPLSFDEAVTDLLKIKPEPRAPKKRRSKVDGARNHQANPRSRKKR